MRFGDPTALGWATTLAYLALSVLLLSNAKRKDESWTFWASAGLITLALGINKQADLQTDLSATVKSFLLEFGGYEHRRVLQLVFLGALALLALAGLYWMRRWFAHERTRVSAIGLALMATFVVLRAATFHLLDRWFGAEKLTAILGATLEWIALLVVAWGGFRWRRRHA